MNEQPISRIRLDPNTIAVNSIFDTIQGEGPFAGQPATFVRLAGCNLQCPYCDTEYTKSEEMSHADILKRLLMTKRWPQGRLIVISGGEPFRQPIGALVSLLLQYDFRVQIETNGTLYSHGPWARTTIVCSPKTGRINAELSPHITCYKYVVSADDINLSDGLPNHVLGSKANVARPNKHDPRIIYLQPADQRDEYLNAANRAVAISSCLNFGYTLCLQIHKIIGME